MPRVAGRWTACWTSQLPDTVKRTDSRPLPPVMILNIEWLEYATNLESTVLHLTFIVNDFLRICFYIKTSLQLKQVTAHSYQIGSHSYCMSTIAHAAQDDGRGRRDICRHICCEGAHTDARSLLRLSRAGDDDTGADGSSRVYSIRG